MNESTKDYRRRIRGRKPIYWYPVILLVASFLGCGGVVGSGPSQPPPPDVSVSVAPVAVSVLLGATQTFAATVTNAKNTSVTWSVNGIVGGTTGFGTIDANGVYTAPQILPAPARISVTATSVADPSKNSSAAVTITSSFSVTLTGPTSVNGGATVIYNASLTPAANSNPSRILIWSVSGAGCSGAACGTISSSGTYTAPAIPPAPATIQVTATPLADASKAAVIAVTILATPTIVLSPNAATLAPSSLQTFHAQVSGVQNTTVTWDVNGIVGGNAVVGVILNSQIAPNDTTYTAPATIPPGGSVTVRASSNANPNITASAIVSFSGGISITLAPANATRAAGRRQTLTAVVNNTTNQNISWTVDTIAAGNLSVGQICLSGSNPCQPISIDASGKVDYLAPAGIPFPNPVAVMATSQLDGTTTSSAFITILPHIAVSITPGNVVLAKGVQMQFAAVVIGTDNQQVIWNVSGSGCATPALCGTINSSGLYTAPATPPIPNLIQVLATSSDDTTQSASASVTLSGGPFISTISPSSAYAGSAGGFTLAVAGINFSPSSPGPGSTILVTGTPRATLCASEMQCTTSLAAADLQSAGNLSVQMQNPDGASSNFTSFVVLDQGAGADTIALTPGAPTATGKDIVVVELSTNGSANISGSVPLNIAAIGAYSVSSNSCVLADSPVMIIRPASGIAAADLCVFSLSGLDPSFTYTVSGPAAPDISILNRAALGFGILHLTLQVPATAAAGPRTLFVQNPAKDMAAGTGTIEVH